MKKIDLSLLGVLQFIWMSAIAVKVFWFTFLRGVAEILACWLGVDWREEITALKDKKAWAKCWRDCKANSAHEWRNIKLYPQAMLRLVAGFMLFFILMLLDIWYDISLLWLDEDKEAPLFVPDIRQ